MRISRLLIFFLATTLSIVGIYSFISLPLRIESMINNTTAMKTAFYIWYFVLSYAWFAYFAMGFYWAANKKINKKFVLSAHYPAAVAAALLVGSFYGLGFFVTVLPAVIMAFYLVRFHVYSNNVENINGGGDK